MQPPREKIRSRLLEFDLGTSLFESLLGFFGGVLGGAFEDGCGSAFDELLGIGKAETRRHATDGFDDGNLVATTVGQNDVKFALLFSSCTTGVATSGRSGGSCRAWPRPVDVTRRARASR